MKHILITGANSYIGTSLEEWVNQWPEQYDVCSVDMKEDSWYNLDFSIYDVVFHVAGIAHVDTHKVHKNMQDIYYKVNRDLTIRTAEKAKKDGVKQFIFMSSIIVYGESGSIKNDKVISKDTIPLPNNFYGDSKLQAEKGVLSLQSSTFQVVILRPPMIYGKGSKGNYPKLSTLAKKVKLFPDIINQRSMLHIDNLCEFIRLMIDNEESGIFFPQNDEYTCTSEMLKMIAQLHGNNIKLTKIFNSILYHIPINIKNKVFGTLVYEKELSKYKYNYHIHTYKDSIRVTEI